ncbi:MAG: hypothetical protein Q8O59_02805 [bacterium]|nr:hypothetical protein [bacterium]
MKQMVAPNAQVEKTITLTELLSNGFFRKVGDKEAGVFYRYHQPGYGWVFSPVLVNGRVSKFPRAIINLAETVEVISQEELGVGRIYWA